MENYIATLVNGLTNDVRQVQIESLCPELAHKDIYFKHADKSEEIKTIVDDAQNIVYSDVDGFSSMPDWTPENKPDVIPVVPDVISTSQKEKEVNY